MTGYSNKLISDYKKVLVSWKESKNIFEGKPCTWGYPKKKFSIFLIRLILITISLLYVSAGKTGSHIINENIYNSLEKLLTFCNVIHQWETFFYKDFEKVEKNMEVGTLPGSIT